MTGEILTYNGEKPEALGSPDVEKILALFKQQNKMIELALTCVVVIPEGTRIRSAYKPPKETDND